MNSGSSCPATSFERLSKQQLALIFSHLTCPELLRAEQVCRLWKAAIDEYLWGKVLNIKEETIGYPEDGNYLNNFIRLARRVHEVKEMINIFKLVDRSLPLHRGLEAELKPAMLELIRKRTPDAVFPLDVISSVVTTEYIEHKKKKGLRRQGVRAAIEKSLSEFQVYGFEAIRVNTFLLGTYKSEKDSFVVVWSNGQVAMPFRLHKITNLVIGCLVVRMTWNGLVASAIEAHFTTLLQRLATLPKLQSVTVESIQLLLPHRVEGREPLVTVNVSFNPLDSACQFPVAEFGQFLVKMMKYSDETRIKYLAECVKMWIEETGKVKWVELRIRYEKFDIIEALSLQDDSALSDEDVPLMLLIGQFYPNAIDSLHLTIEKDCDNENRFFSLLGECVLSRLKNLTVVFSHDVRKKGKNLWDDFRGAVKAKAIFRALAEHANKAVNLERLNLDFRAGGVECMSVLLEPMDGVKGPLPKLRTLECYGLPCIPFIVSLVSQAPNLRHLVVESHVFQSYDGGVRGFQDIVAALQGCHNLLTVSIKVVEVDQKMVCGPVSRPRKRRRSNDDEYSNLWTSLEEKFDQLVAAVVSLVRAEVVIDDEFFLKMDKHPKTTLKTKKG